MPHLYNYINSEIVEKVQSLVVFNSSKKIIFLLVLLISFITACFLYLGHLHYRMVLDSVVDSERQIATKIYTNTFKLITDHYESVAVNLLMNEEVIDAFEKRDRDKLLKLTEPVFKTMVAQNPYLDIMHFHTPDSHSFLRVHQPEKFGDDLSSFRYIINDVNAKKVKQIGMEVGRYGIDYRVALPVFNKKGEHIGSFEFGLNMKYLYDILHNDYKIENVVFLNKDVFSIIHEKNKNIQFKSFSNQYYVIEPSQHSIAASLPQTILDQRYTFITYRGAVFLAFPVTDLKAVTGEEIGKIIFIKNMDEYSRKIRLIRLISIVLGILLVGVSYYLMTVIFNRYTKAIAAYQSQLEIKNRTLGKLSNIDFLTKINNRRCMQKILNKELKRAKRYDKSLSVILFDVDNFKSINDTYGHNAGDKVLKSISRIVSKMIRESDHFGRWGGEEFILILPETSLENAALLAEEIRHDLENFNFEEPSQVTCSFGISEYTGEAETSELVSKSDHALYEAKENGKNRVELFRSE